ncbi:MAG TPA: DNA-processing protein DprA [Candidatus Limnocylindrales bacterium]|nr:DNA-processing protein DprA [Candidatus Limnocylindrales bacterium]
MLGVGLAGPVGGDGIEEASDLGPVGPATSPPATRPWVQTGEERDAWAVLAGVHGIGPVAFAALLARYGDVVSILREASSPGGVARLANPPDDVLPDAAARALGPEVAQAIAEAAGRASATLARIRELGLRVLTVEDPLYPMRLARIEMPPHVLYLLGDPAALSADAAVAIVGTRRATDGGRAFAARLATNLVAVGASVVSGLAVGIDGAAHAAAVHAHGTTVAVIGSGHAVLHPHAHSRLAASIVAAGGAVVSELGPDIAPSKGTFPRRNRIVSGLADATVVVEAPARSGALITASWALEQGRECFFVPGAVDAPASAGCLSYLREFPDRARIVAGIPQLIEDLGLADRLVEPDVPTDVAATLSGIGEAAKRLAHELVRGRATVDELVAATGWPVASVLAGLTLLERRGLAVGIHGRFRPAGTLAGTDPGRRRQRPRPARLATSGGPRA